jgi:hypothetical protein
MPCMCGDICCPSCGPAQGNSKCGLCEEWASEGCIHYDEETGNYKLEYQKAIEEAARKEYEEMARWSQDWEKEN